MLNMDDQDRRTLWCGNLSEKTTEEILYELFLQAGPLEKVSIPKDKDGRQRNYGFVTYVHEVSVPFAIELFRGTELHQRSLSLQFRGGGAKHSSFKTDCQPMRDFSFAQNDIQQRFEEMTNQVILYNPLPNSQYGSNNIPNRQDEQDCLSAASLQGNWSTRHHPYQRDEFREPKGHYNAKHQRNGGHQNSHGRSKNNRRHFNDDHRGGGYNRGYKNKNNR